MEPFEDPIDHRQARDRRSRFIQSGIAFAAVVAILITIYRALMGGG